VHHAKRAHTLPLDGGLVFEQDGVSVRAFRVVHGEAQPAYGFRIDYGGQSVVLSGDATYSPRLIESAQGVQLLVHSLSIGSRQLEAAEPAYVQSFYRYLACSRKRGRSSPCSRTSRSTVGATFRVRPKPKSANASRPGMRVRSCWDRT
jgi:hypothetical protein